MINFIFRKWVKWQKSWLLRGVRQDMDFIRKFRADWILVSTEDKLRSKLALERRKEKPDALLIDRIAEDIATAQAIRLEYEKLKKLEVELPEYISML